MAACTEPNRKAAGAVDPEWLTETARKGLGPDLRFSLADQQEPHHVPEIGVDTARLQAAAYLATFGSGFQSWWEEDRGEAIDLQHLRVCDRIYYARRAYEEIDTTHLAPFRRPYGPWWLASFCNPAGDEIGSLAISAYNTGFLLQGGLIYDTAFYQGNSFSSSGTPRTFRHLTMSPEQAVCLAYAQTGKRIAAAPVLEAPRAGIFQYAAHWRVTLESAVDVELADSTRQSTNEVWIGSGGPSTEVYLAVSTGTLADQISDYDLLDHTGAVTGTRQLVAHPRTGRGYWMPVVQYFGVHPFLMACPS